MSAPRMDARTRGRVAALQATTDPEQAAEILHGWLLDAYEEGKLDGVAQAARDSWATS